MTRQRLEALFLFKFITIFLFVYCFEFVSHEFYHGIYFVGDISPDAETAFYTYAL